MLRKIKLLTLLNALLAISLVSALLLTSGTMISESKNETAGYSAKMEEYDPWADINDDGLIDMKDIYYLVQRYMTTGTPINETALLLELQSKVDALEARVSELERKPKIVTFSEEGLRGLPPTNWTDLLAIHDVTVSEGANAIVFATAYFIGRGFHHDYALCLRHRANTAYGEGRYEGFDTSSMTHIVEIHHTWLNLTTGTYTFAIQSNTKVPLYVANLRLTVIVF